MLSPTRLPNQSLLLLGGSLLRSPNQWLQVHVDRDFHAATSQGELVSYSVTKPVATLKVSDPALEEYLAARDGVHLASDKNCPQIILERAFPALSSFPLSSFRQCGGA